MGLDMYMSKKTYVKNWEHMKPEAKHQVIILKGTQAKDDGKGNLIVPKTSIVDDEYVDLDKVKYIEEEVAYWRKANAIHQWFVDNVQKGVDDCGEYAVEHYQIEDLVEICERILNESKLVKGKIANGSSFKDGEMVPIMEDGEYIENPEVAEELLPTSSGFFFGSTDYDQWYIQDLEETIKQLKPLTEKNSEGKYKIEGDFYYSSSW